MNIKLLISDFDGTLVDTFEANYLAYRDAFSEAGYNLTEAKYRECFGKRFDDFMNAVGIEDSLVKEAIREGKTERYPHYFDHLKVNHTLLSFIRSFKASGGKTAIASTARKKNLFNALRHIGAIDDFDFILAGENVKHAKPDGEIYTKLLELAGVRADEALIFEDTEVGFAAAKNAGISYITITKGFFSVQ